MAKLNVTWKLGRAPIGAVFVGVLALLLLGGCGGGAEPARPDSKASNLEDQGHKPTPALFSAQSHPYGFSMETWAENWWRWVLSIPAAQNPFLSLTSDCSAGQGGQVFYVPPFPPGSKNLTRSCTVEQGQAVAVTLSSVLNDYPCPDPTFQPAPGQSLFDFLLAGAVAGNGDIAEIDVTLDGEPLNDILSYHFASKDLMFFTGDLSLQSTVDSCITGGSQPAVVDSYIILFKPLRPGHHTITRRVVTTRGTVSGPNTTEILVLDERELGKRQR
jgi:hypothetical protein